MSTGSILLVGICFFFTAFPNLVHADTGEPPCFVVGNTNVSFGETSTFTPSSCSVSVWTVSCATIVSQSSSSVTVIFDVPGCTSATIGGVKVGGGNIAGITFPINPAQPVSGGSISTTPYTISFGVTPALISTLPATGGTCSGAYQYQWYSSSDNITFTAISGALLPDFQPPALYMTTYFKRMVTCGGTAYTNTLQITVSGPSSGVGPATNSSGNANIDRNWILSSNYDAMGNIISEQKSFFDDGGKLLQTQDKIRYRREEGVVYSHVFATQPLYDVYGRAAAKTLAAPIDYADFNYSPNFIRDGNGAVYTYKNFDKIKPPAAAEIDKTNSPDQVGSQNVKGTLGWYYGAENSWEPYAPTTGYPFVRETYFQDGTGNVKKNAGAGEIFRVGTNHERQQYITATGNELDNYIKVRNQFFSSGTVGSSPDNLRSQVFQVVQKDEQGTETISIQDKSGKALIIGRPGTEYQPPPTTLNVSAANMIAYGQRIIAVSGTAVSVQAISSVNLINAYLVSSAGTISYVYSGYPTNFPYNTNLGSGSLVLESDVSFNAAYTSSGSLYIINSGNFSDQKIGTTAYFKIFADNTPVTLTGDYKLYNMESEVIVNMPVSMLNKGYYKLVSNTGYTSITYSNGYNDLSYNFYNQLGQLVASIAPEGVKKLYGTYSYATKNDLPFITLFGYDTQGRLVNTTSPDAGTSQLLYRTDGKIRFSQNAVQAASGTGKFSYTNYDAYGRAIEAGEYEPASGGIDFNSVAMASIVDNTSSTGGLINGVKRDVIVSVFDVTDNTHSQPGYTQTATNLGSFLSTTKKYNSIINNVPSTINLTSQTWYNYDEEGKVIWQVKMMKNMGGGSALYKTIDIFYDAMGHAIKKVFQKNTPSETFVHYFKYDPANQQLWKVYTNTTDAPIEPLDLSYKLQATYKYYLHGGLKRIELAGQLQGIDYTYTLQGALKAINNNKRLNDPGGDGTTNSFAQDAFGMVLDYYTDDYKNTRTSGILPINGVNAPNDNYAGNVKAMSWYSEKPAIPGLNDNPVAYLYKYDDKYQLTESMWATGLGFSSTQGIPTTYTPTTLNSEKLLNPANSSPGYDGNGNILYLQRTNESGTLQDKFAYSYTTNTNKLQSVVNSASGSNVTYATYGYNQAGQVITETNTDPNKTKYLQYDVTGKVITVAKDANFFQVMVRYVYDESGRRIQKILYNTSNSQVTQVIYYFEDVIFTQDVANAGNPIAQEYTINSGSGRLGIFYRQSPVYAYQLTDHLGNVRAVIAQSGATFAVRMYTDYYPYGMEIAKGGTNDYRYGYQGNYSEKDGETDWNSFELRMYDSRIARWLQHDPKGQFYSPYIGMGNDPVKGVDPDGGVVNPFIDLQGNLLGTDELGLQGAAIVIDRKDWKASMQGMNHEAAMKLNKGIGAITNLRDLNKFNITFKTLKYRPDWDGVVTKSEADEWYSNGSAQPLYVDIAKFNLGLTTTASFENGHYTANFGLPVPATVTGQVFGTLDLELLNEQTGEVRIGYQYIAEGNTKPVLDRYDFEMHEVHGLGSLTRNIVTDLGSPKSGEPFNFEGYGHKFVPVFNPAAIPNY